MTEQLLEALERLEDYISVGCGVLTCLECNGDDAHSEKIVHAPDCPISILRDGLTGMQPTQERERWIPVEERLPEEELDILVVFNTGAVYPVVVTWRDDELLLTMYMTNGRMGRFDRRHITHWRPLPAPPIVDKDGA